MKAFSRSIKGLFLFLVAAFLAGCATGSGSFATETMSNQDYVAKSQAERAKYRQAVSDEAKIVEEKEWLEYLSGRPIFTGSAETARTIQWDKRAKMVYIYPGHNPRGMGLETYAAIALVTDNAGEIKYDERGNPLKIFINAAVQEDFLRATLKTFATAVPSAFNGAIGAKIQADSCKDSGCGSGGNLINVQTNSGAAAQSSTHGTIGVTTSGGCGAACAPKHAD